MSLHPSERRTGAQDLRGAGGTLYPHSSGHFGKGQGSARCVQQLGGILSREVRDGESAERRRFETAPKKVRCAHGNQKS